MNPLPIASFRYFANPEASENLESQIVPTPAVFDIKIFPLNT